MIIRDDKNVVREEVAYKFFVINKKGTNKFLPSGRGHYTSSEPTDGFEIPPRMFTKRSSAAKALNAWKKGSWFLKGIDLGYGYYGQEWDEEFSYKPVPERDAIELEVIEVRLVY